MEMKKINIKRKQLNLSNSTAGMERENDEEPNKSCLKFELQLRFVFKTGNYS